MSVSSWFYKKTSKSSKKPEDGELHNELMKHSQAVLASGNLRLAVTLPEGEDKNEWLAVNTVDFFHQISMIYGTISEWCTIESCPVMSAGPKYEYHWADGKNIKRAIRVPACQYVEYLTSWVQSQLEDDRIFPVRMDAVFAPDFEDIVKQIFRRLFRVYAHIYHSHFSNIILLGEEAHLNTSFKHFIYFVKEFNLIEDKELGPLSELIECLRS